MRYPPKVQLSRLVNSLTGVAAFLLSDEASYVNGVDLVVDGGLCAALRDDWTGVPPTLNQASPSPSSSPAE